MKFFVNTLDDFVVCYIDDILIFSKNIVDRERHVCFILQKIQKVGIYAKLEKCGFHQFEVEFLGYIISRDTIRMDLCKVQTIMDWATPTFVRIVQCLFGFANFYQRFITHYFMIGTLLIHLT